MTVINSSTRHSTNLTANSDRIIDVQYTNCCIVGGGPAGAVLALLLARQGVPVTLLEAHKDFNRYFRGDTIHPSVMEIMDELGLADRLLQLRHSKTHQLISQTKEGSVIFADFSRLKSRFPYVVVMEQVRFLEFIVAEAKQYPHFQLRMSANVQQLIEKDGIIRGVRYRGEGGCHEVRAELTVGADGRHSRTRNLAGLKLIKKQAPIDVLWFRLPRYQGDPQEELGEFGRNGLFALTNRFDYWQVGYIIPKGYYQELHRLGLDALRNALVETIPLLKDRVAHLDNWKQVALLKVDMGHVSRWYRSGLLLIGDAAHVMSPVGGVGINYAIQDAVVTANIVGNPLKNNRLKLRHLAAVQRQRNLPTRIIQWFQCLSQDQVIVKTLKSGQPFSPPKFMNLPPFRDLPTRLMGHGICPVHVKS